MNTIYLQYKPVDKEDYLDTLEKVFKVGIYFHQDKKLTPEVCWKRYSTFPLLGIDTARKYLAGYKIPICIGSVMDKNTFLKKAGILVPQNNLIDLSL